MAARETLTLDAGPSPTLAPGQVTFIGTATTLLEVAGFRILTDPNFLRRGQRAYVGMGISTRRLTEPSTSIAQLPPLDFVVLSHHHGDHFDRVTAAELDRDVPILTEPHAARKLGRQGFRRPVALTTWETQTVVKGAASVQVTAVPGKHAPVPLGYVVPPVMGSMLDFAVAGEPRLRVYITGDTLMHEGIHQIARRYPGVDLCIVHLGGTKIAGILLTMDGRQGVEALRVVAPRHAVPVHYDDYTLFKSPLSDFRAEVARAPRLGTEVHYLGRGETFAFQLPTGPDGVAGDGAEPPRA